VHKYFLWFYSFKIWRINYLW